ncbi:MAG: chromosome segregation protein SMC [Thermomicrobiales bacterium]|nr:chromosome segregation protein SMC [Thermomicrobiales bacterium]
MTERSVQPTPRLSRLEMHGFKSFATKTTLVFEPGITAVVGPNGSGKSNIADAVRWVLGETSPSTIRSKKSEDVIFAGGKGKSPSGMAEVTVTFNNEERWLPSEFTEVTVTRRAFRGGGGEYLINGRKVRLKDVQRLTASLGHSYTVVGQGLVDAALSQRAEERRGLFEHAADLTGLRLRVVEAERNLAETDTNVTRLSDLLSQIEPNLKRLERAARQQKEWKGLRDRQIYLQRGHYRRLLLAASSRLQDAETEAAYQQAALSDTQTTLDQLIANRPQMEQQLQDTTHALEIHDVRLGELRLQLSDVKHRGELVSERISALERRALDAQATKTGLQEQLATSQARLEAAQSELAEIERELSTARESAQRQQQLALVARGDRQKAETDLSAIARDALQQERRLADLQQQHALSVQRQETSASDTERLLAEVSAQNERLQTLTAELADHEQLSKEITDQLTNLATQMESAESEIASGQAMMRTAMDHRADLERQRNQLQYRLDALQRMHDSGEGLYQGPRQVMQWHTAGKLQGVLGTLAELIVVDKQYDTALEIALGGHLQDVVVREWRDAEAAISMLKQQRAGRATFQPIETVRRRNTNRQVPREIEGATGVHGIASDLVRSDTDVAEVVRALLGRIVVVDDLPTSRRLLDALPNGWSTVTLAGEIARSGGSVTGGSQGRDSGMLARERELRELPDTISALEKKLTAAATDVSTHEGPYQAAVARRSQLHAERSDLAAQQRALAPQHQRLQQWIADIAAQQETAARHRDAAAIIASDRESKLASLATEIEAAQIALTELRERESDLAATLAHQRDWSTEFDDALATANAQLAALEERKRAEERQLNQVQSQLRAQKTEINARENDEAEMQGRKLALQDELSRLEIEVAQLSAAVDEGDSKRVPLQHTLNQHADLVRTLQREIESARQWTMENERALGQAELLLERARADVGAIHQRIMDDLNIEVPNDLIADTRDQDYSELPEDLDETEREISRLRNRLHRVGYVGDNVVEEYEQEAERFAFLNEQLADVQQASVRLRAMLAELHQTMQTRFEETFERVSQEFSQAFTVLFGGGLARLVLAPDDEGAPGGIDIVAQPPGKRLQGLALLSGGERSLTAVALLFAILRVNPSPFVLLDEVDAALDEANVVRFRDELRTLADQTQAIVITHNRGTVESADTLYGITMGGDGVSQTLSLRLSDLPMEEDFDIRDLPAVSAGIPVR